jgi:ADP-heptose:LPS heptosyltransferase
MGVRECFTPGGFRRAPAPPAPTRSVVFHPFSRTPAKTWPAFHTKSFLRLMSEAGIGVTLIGGSDHREDSERWAAEGCVFTDRVGTTEPAALFDLIAETGLFVGVDSGPGHIAPLVGAPILTIASGTNEGRRFMPWGAEIVRHHVVCAPCRRESCPVDGHPCMAGVAAERVAEAALRLLGAA